MGFQILVDADACPVVPEIEHVAKKYGVSLQLFCDTNHVLSSEVGDVHVIGAGADAVDIAVANACKKGDVVVTQDYGVAAMVLGKGAHAVHQNGGSTRPKTSTACSRNDMSSRKHVVPQKRRISKAHASGQQRMTNGSQKNSSG